MTPPAIQSPPPDGDTGVRYRDFWGALATQLAVVLLELALLQLFAIGATTGIYHLAPQLDVGSPRGFRDWLSILQVVSATLTLPGGAAIVLSIWLASRWARTADQERVDAQQRADAAQQEAKKWHDEAVAAQSENADLKAQNVALLAQSERRGRRRRLRR